MSLVSGLNTTRLGVVVVFEAENGDLQAETGRGLSANA